MMKTTMARALRSGAGRRALALPRVCPRSMLGPLLGLLAGALVACGASDTVAVDASKPVFFFAAVPDQGPAPRRERFDRIADYLRDELGVRVTYVPVDSQADAVTALANNRVQLAWFGGLSGVRARQRVTGAIAIARGAEDKVVRSYFIANATTGIRRGSSFARNIRDLSFTFGARDSTAGRLMPEYYIRREFGTPPDEVFERVGFSGDPARTIERVQSGAFALGAVDSRAWARAQARIDPDRVRIIWATPPFADYQWTIRGDVDGTWGAGFTAQVTRALLDMAQPELLQAFARSAFVPASNADYAPLRKAARIVDLLD